MNTMSTTILKDQNRLVEIYHLRVLAYEKARTKTNINFTSYPNGYFDHLEKNSLHFVCSVKNKIIAAARLTKLSSINQLPYSKAYAHIEFPPVQSFWYFSRLVVHPDFRGKNLRHQLDNIRFDYLDTELDNSYAMMTARGWRVDELIAKGCSLIGEVDCTLDNFHPISENEKTRILIYKIDKHIL